MNDRKQDNLALYTEYNKTLRAWLVAFGVGVPALFITSETALAKLAASQNASLIVCLFLIGAAAQILMAFLNKTIAWCAYRDADKAAGTPRRVIKWIAGAENWYLIDFVLDLVSMAMFSISTFFIAALLLTKEPAQLKPSQGDVPAAQARPHAASVAFGAKSTARALPLAGSGPYTSCEGPHAAGYR